MPVQQFNPLASPNGPVSAGGTIGSATPPASHPSATGRPSGLIQNDGTANLRINAQTLNDGGNTTPGAMKNRSPAQSFNPASV